VDFGALSKARLAAGESGVRRAGPTPGASGPSAVGMSSTYWVTDDAPGLGPSTVAGFAGSAKLSARSAITATTDA
jgi:hypothetical protein